MPWKDKKKEKEYNRLYREYLRENTVKVAKDTHLTTMFAAENAEGEII